MNSVDKLVRRILSVESQVKALATTPSLANSSIEDGAIDVNSGDGDLMMSIGQQFDGTHVAATLSGPTPPTPSAPQVTAEHKSLTVRWDGVFLNEDGVPDVMVTAPMDFSRVEVHISDQPDFDPSFAETLWGTIETPRGTPIVATPLEGGVMHYVRLITRALTGKPSEPSPQVSATPLEYMPIEGLKPGSVTGREIASGAIDVNQLAPRSLLMSARSTRP